MMTRQQFYRSSSWLAFRRAVIESRIDSDGNVHCERCGKPIVRKYDLIVHHKVELTEANVNDAMVALNPTNMEVVCFHCHNTIHDRFVTGHSATYRPQRKKVYIVYGSPCAGKTTWVHEVADPEDLVVDMDSIWQMVGISDRYIKPDALRTPVFEVRDRLYDIIRYRSGAWHNAYIIAGAPMKGDRDRLMKRVGADECILIDTGKDECIARIQSKGLPEEQKLKWEKYIEEWFSQYQED